MDSVPPEQNQTVSSTLQAESHPHPKDRLMKIIIAGIIFLLLCTTLVFGYKLTQQKETQLVPTTEPSPTPAVNEASDWKTYTNSISHFSIKLPSSWKEIEHSSSFENMSIYEAPDSSQIMIEVISTKESLEDYLENLDKINSTGWEGQPSKTVKSTKQISIGSLNGIQQSEDWLAAGFTTTITYIKNEDNIASITILPYAEGDFTSQEASLYYDQILSTFRFLEEEVTDWKTYTNEFVSFDYPSNWIAQDNPEYPGGNNVSFFAVNTTPDHSYGDHSGNELFAFSIEEDTRTLSQLKNEYYPDALLTQVNGKDALKTSFGLYVVKINNQQKMNIVTGKTNQDVSDYILSTFLFTEE